MEQDPELWNVLGLAYGRKGMGDAAIKAFGISASIDDEYADTFNNLGSIYLSQYMQTRDKNAFNKTVNNFKRVIALDSCNSSAYNNLGAVYMTAGMLPEAIHNWEKVIGLNSNAGKTFYYLGLAYLAQQNTSRAMYFLIDNKHKFYDLLAPAEKQRLDILIAHVKENHP